MWLADVRLSFDSVSRANAQAAVAVVLAMYDRDNRLAVRWEQRFAHPRTKVFPFGLSRKHRELMRTYFRE